MKRVVPLLLLLSICLFWYVVYPNHISNQAFFSLFQSDSVFFLYFCGLPGGVAEWCGAFLSLFYDRVWTGVLIQSLFPAAVYCMARTLRPGGNPGTMGMEAWCMLPAALLSFLQMQYAFLAGNALQAVLWYAALWGYMRIGRGGMRLCAAIAGMYPVSVLSGGLPSLLWAVTVSLYEVRLKSCRRNGVAVLLSWLACFMAWRWLCPQAGREWYTFFPRVQEFRHQEVAWLLFLWFPATLMLLSGKRSGETVSRFFSGAGGWVVAVVTAAVLFSWWRLEFYRPRVEGMLGLQREAVLGDWEGVLSVAERERQELPAVIAVTNLALSHMDALAERALEFPQSGIAGLIPEGDDYLSMLCRAWVYDRLGVKNEALRCSVEAAIAHGDNPPPFLMRQIATLLMETGRETAAARFLKRLAAVPFQREWARERLRRTAVVEYRRKLRISEPFRADSVGSAAGEGKEDFSVGSMGPFYDLFLLAERHPRNVQVRDYLLTALLLAKDIPTFYGWFVKYYPSGYAGALPGMYREALVLVGATKLDTEVHRKYRVVLEELDGFGRYMERCRAFGNDKEAAEAAVRGDYGNTLWYYMHFR